jgi:hypothetical protein
MGSKFKRSEAVEIILEALRSDGLRRLCEKREIPYGRSDGDRRDRLANAYRRALPDLVTDLRRADLIAALGNVTFEVDEKEYELGRLHKATLAELQMAATAVFVGDWAPAGKGEGPTGSGPIDTYRTDDGLEEDEEDEADFDFAMPFDALDKETSNLFQDLDEEAERPDARLPSFEHVNPGASSPEGRHDASLTDFQLEAVAALDRHFGQPGARGTALSAHRRWQDAHVARLAPESFRRSWRARPMGHPQGGPARPGPRGDPGAWMVASQQ